MSSSGAWTSFCWHHARQAGLWVFCTSTLLTVAGFNQGEDPNGLLLIGLSVWISDKAAKEFSRRRAVGCALATSGAYYASDLAAQWAHSTLFGGAPAYRPSRVGVVAMMLLIAVVAWQTAIDVEYRAQHGHGRPFLWPWRR